MKVLLNNSEQIVSENTSIDSLLQSQKMAERTGIAVAVNGSVIPKKDWSRTTLNENDKLMIITATAGG